MNGSLIDDLKRAFGPVTFCGGARRLTNDGWYRLEITPFPSKTELPLVVSDIIHNKMVDMKNGKVVHLDSCNATHPIHSKVVKEALDSIKPQSYVVAVYPGNNLMNLGRQPIAVVLEPEISHMVYPDHPHLNTGGFDLANQFYFPNSICYTDRPNELGDSEFDRLLHAFDLISIWLLRHSIWVETKKYAQKGIWIGPEAAPWQSHHFVSVLNPEGKCRCGSDKKYSYCHRKSDVSDLIQLTAKMDNHFKRQVIQTVGPFLTNGYDTWNIRVRRPSIESMRNLKKAIL